MCDPGSINFLNSLAAWASLNMSVTPTPTRTYYNLDGSAVQVSPADMAEFLSAVGAAVQSTFDAVAKVRTAITSCAADDHDLRPDRHGRVADGGELIAT